MLSMSEIKVGRLVRISGEPYAVIKTDHHKMGRGGAVLKIKVKNLLSGNILDKTIQGNEKLDEAETEKRKVNYLYKDERQAFFMDNQSYDQFSLDLETLGEKIYFMKEGADVDALYFEGKPAAIDLPIKIKLKVTSAPPGVKGNSAGSVNKKVTLETGAEIAVPMFIKEGDEIIFNTDSGEYVERA
jgi:elongation factor P